MLCFLFGLFRWSKAPKCKVLLKRVRCRLKLLRNKREAIVKQEREVIAQLLKNGHNPDATLSRAEQLFKDQSTVAAYDLLDQFCEFIIMNIPYIRKHKDCPNDINEAISTLIFASSRCANLPELQKLRKLFCRRYGSSFELAAVEACPGDHVNEQMREKLSLTTVTEDAKFNLIQEIAQEFDVKYQVKDANLIYNHHASENDVYERDVQVVYSEIGHVGKMKSDSYANGVLQIEEQKQTGQVEASLPFDASMHRFNQRRPPAELGCSPGSSDITTNSAIAEGKTPNDVRGVLEDFSNFDGKNRDPLTMKSESTSSCSRKRREPRRQRPRIRFLSGHQHKFAAGVKRDLFLLAKFEECLQYYDGISDQSDRDSNDSHSKNKMKKSKIGNQSRLANGRRRRRTSSTSKPPRRFSFGYEQGEKPNRRCKYVSRRSSLPGHMNMNTDCSLEHPCYFLASDYEMDPNRSVFELHSQEDADITCGESKSGKNREAPDPNHGSPQRKLPACWRAMSMPVERSEMEGENKLGGCGSSSFRHIHPKQPDYDDVAAMFSALKEEHVKSRAALHRTKSHFLHSDTTRRE